MAIDTQNRRKAAIAVGRTWRLFPVPDGSISAADRRHMAGGYRYPADVVGVGGPYDVVTGQLYVPGTQSGEVHTPGARAGEVNS